MNKKTLSIIVIILIIVISSFYFLGKEEPKNSGANLSQSLEPSQKSSENYAVYDIQGMKIEILKEGTGEGARVGDSIAVDYTGTLLDGTKFDSSIGREPFEYTLGQNRVIQGWELGLVGMKVGEKRKLTIPPELGYGASGAGNIIPPNATLIFEIDMISIK